jgi:phosphoribosyl 1,2-cyclic phosphodiesterase
MSAPAIAVTFWGVRGSVPTPGPDTTQFGGNTPCIEVRCGPHVLVFDAGSGIRPLGDALARESVREVDLLFTHCHYDHICGLPFFSPLFQPECTIRLWSGHLAGTMTTRDMIASFMRPPFFPQTPACLKAQVDYRDFRPGDILAMGNGLTLHTTRLKHPGGCVGYRLSNGGRTFCYVCDTEHVPGAPDEAVLDLVRGADVVVYDAAYTDAEFPAFVGYGHSTWQEGVRLCELAGAGRCVVFHHGPARKDDELSLIAAEAERLRPGTLVAREGLRLEI